jgi:hypothetical protein
MSEYYALQRHCTNTLPIGEAKVRQANRVGISSSILPSTRTLFGRAIVNHTKRGKPLPKQSPLCELNLDPDCANCSPIGPVVLLAAS